MHTNHRKTVYVTDIFRLKFVQQVIRSLKKAMQPAVTDTQISYTVPNSVTATSAPDSVPSIFVGERMIVYGILRSSSPLTESQEGSIRLSGDLLGAKIEHNMKFQVPVSVTKESVSQVSTIHHLAAKKLIKEMELNTSSRKNNAELIQLSCNSNVICSKTAFIAIDEERKEAVKGSLETWDILADEDYEYVCSALTCTMPQMYALHRADPPPPPGAGFKMKSAAPCMKSSSMPIKFPGELLAKHSQAISDISSESGDDDDDMGCDTSEVPAIISSGSALKNPLSIIINLQLADGSWELSKDLADVVGQPTTTIQEACPVPCKGATYMYAIWATVIVLSYLKLRQLNFKDEWELVALKAETWIKKQNLPQGCSIQVLREKSTAFFS